MTRAQRPASVHLRMAPQLREALRAAADDAGCSLNAFALQVLSAAAGDASRFRRAEDAQARVEATRPVAKWRHLKARNAFMNVMLDEQGSAAMTAMVRRYDAEEPGYYLEWERAREAESA